MQIFQPPHSPRKTPPFFFSLPETSNQPPLTSHTPLSLLKPTGAPVFEQTLSNPLKLEPLLYSHGVQRKLRQGQPNFWHVSFQRRHSALNSAVVCTIRHTSGLRPALPGTGFETLPPLAISTGLFKFLKCLGLNSVGLGLDCVPFHAGWELVVWEPCLS